MTPKEKAIELVDKYLRTYPIGINPTVTISYTTNEAKQCALIAVDEIIDECRVGMDWFWQEVKEEIELL
jgi:hypothetical protein